MFSQLSEWIEPVVVAASLLGGGIGVGCMLGVSTRNELRAQLEALRLDLIQRAKREDEMVRGCLARLGAEMDAERTNRVIDRSPTVLAEMLRKQRAEQANQEWEGVEGESEDEGEEEEAPVGEEGEPYPVAS